ncbi:hypothetical protein J4T96_gp109 [Mycobacterium phage Finemlucis]|uniref:Uncharacterized protein n=1 Tax=Mycobacterium phage Finemlucis TaxID=2015844 RepID=A0A291IA34_9CAUD|nr:hypothetical protein J4T96_gp109 [Mycobacterium phage Finemlucis]ATG86539.1 hypothetical protein SEA_FINEMLUCIS_138 [Mycobacterium phage Finemlucis]QGZ16636.1 hypothetical protein PBI_GABRIELA_140 [Mycobacterium phage Gabriela]
MCPGACPGRCARSWPDTNQAAPSLRWLAAGLTVASAGR